MQAAESEQDSSHGRLESCWYGVIAIVQPGLLSKTVQYCTYRDPYFVLHLQMSTLRERVLAQLQMSSGPNGSSVTALAEALNEPTVFVRFALEQLRDQGIAFRRGGWWSTSRYSGAFVA